MRSKAAGSDRCSQDSLVTVSAAAGTVPQALAHASGPPSCLMSHAASGAVSVSFHSLAGRSGEPSLSHATRPCCWAATEIAATDGDPASVHADPKADHHAAGSCSLRGGETTGCDARPEATSVPESASRTSTLVAEVDESTPATRRMS